MRGALMPDVVTIREAVDRAKREGYPISEYTLRKWIHSGAIPIRRAGSKILIFYPNLVRYLRCDDGGDNKPASVAAFPGIRRVDL